MTARYPLWCVDRDGAYLAADEPQYLGPFETEQDARAAADAPDQVRRCRRVKASELDGFAYQFTELLEGMDDDAREGGRPDVAWADIAAVVVLPPLPSLETEFKAWADAHIMLEAFVCEGDEPAYGGEGCMLARICTQLTRLEGRLDADTLSLWRKAVADRDVYSPPAKGCLLELVRQAWGDDGIVIERSTVGWGIRPSKHHGARRSPWGWIILNQDADVWPTELEALIAALEAARS